MIKVKQILTDQIEQYKQSKEKKPRDRQKKHRPTHSHSQESHTNIKLGVIILCKGPKG